MKTNAAILYSLEEKIVIDELEIPKLKEGQVLVKILYSGICHTQLSEVRGKRGKDKFLPHVLGHEGTGIVLEVGERVTKVKKDNRVVITWIKGKGAEVSSTQYFSKKWGVVNAGAVSTFMEYAVISENRLVVIPDGLCMPMREASLLGCAVSTGLGAIINNINISPKSKVAIFGLGGIGLSALIGAKICNVHSLFAIDVVEEKLAMAKELGADFCFNAKKQDILTEIKKKTNGLGVDVAFEAVGEKKVMELAFQSICYAGGIAILAGNPSYGEKIEIDPFDLIKGKKIIGTAGGEVKIEEDIPLFFDLYLKGLLPLEKMISHEFKLSKINEAFECLETGKCNRIIIKLFE